MQHVWPALIRDAIASIALAFALSAAFWIIWDVFVLSGFVVFSVLSGVIGVGVARWLHRRLPTALVATAVVRIAVFVALSGIWF